MKSVSMPLITFKYWSFYLFTDQHNIRAATGNLLVCFTLVEDRCAWRNLVITKDDDGTKDSIHEQNKYSISPIVKKHSDSSITHFKHRFSSFGTMQLKESFNG